MIEIAVELVAKPEARGQLELAFGPGGAWSKLVARCPGFRGTTLLGDTRDPRRYLAIDLWDSAALWEQAGVERGGERADLYALFDEWLESRAEVGVFAIRAQGTVRPLGKTRGGGVGERPRRRRR